VAGREPGDASLERRFARAQDARHRGPVAAGDEGVPASELLRHIEEQAELIARARLREKELTKALERERAARVRLTEELARERSRARRLSLQLGEHGPSSEGVLAEALERAEALEVQLGQSWDRIGQLNIQLAWANRPLWRKLLHRRPSR
jgi:hypothetical protein